jgi:uncharacterized protein (DUF433 family)
MEQFSRITHNPAVMGGKACIRGMRVTVGNVLGQLSTGRSIENILKDFPYLEKEDVLEAIRISTNVDRKEVDRGEY